MRPWSHPTIWTAAPGKSQVECRGCAALSHRVVEELHLPNAFTQHGTKPAPNVALEQKNPSGKAKPIRCYSLLCIVPG